MDNPEQPAPQIKVRPAQVCHPGILLAEELLARQDESQEGEL